MTASFDRILPHPLLQVHCGAFADRLFLALTYQRLGQSDKARRQLEETVKAMQDFKPSSWQVKAELDLLRREAEDALRPAAQK
jgi:hypothetical protein